MNTPEIYSYEETPKKSVTINSAFRITFREYEKLPERSGGNLDGAEGEISYSLLSEVLHIL